MVFNHKYFFERDVDGTWKPWNFETGLISKIIGAYLNFWMIPKVSLGFPRKCRIKVSTKDQNMWGQCQISTFWNFMNKTL